MTRSSRLLLPAITLLAAVAGCSTTAPITPPDVPAVLRPPTDQSLQFVAQASGVQIYACTQRADSTAYEWAFKAPEASLSSSSGEALGKHYAGPTWELTDGSKVVGEVKAKDAGPNPTAIPWLMLSAKTHEGSGTLSTTKSIQRVATVGGVAPADSCTAATVGQIARVPYTAKYYFYR